MVDTKKPSLAGMISAGVRQAHGRKITRTAEYTAPGAPPVLVTLALPDWDRFRREKAAAIPEIKGALLAEWALLRTASAQKSQPTDKPAPFVEALAAIERDAAELAHRAVAATYVVEVWDKDRSPDQDPPQVRLGWIAALGVPLDGFTPSMADDLVEVTPDVAPLLLRHAGHFAVWVTERLAEAEEFYLQAKQEETENLNPPQDGMPPAGSLAASVSTPSSETTGGETPSSAPSSGTQPKRSSENA